MLFHPSFRFAREHRLIFEQKAPAAQPGAGDKVPEAELPPQQQKAKEVVNALKEKLLASPKNNLNVISKLAALKFDEAETDEKKFQETYHSALEKAANAYFKTLEGTEEEKAKKVNELFQSAGAPEVKLEGGVLVLGAEAPAEGKKERPKLSPEDEKFVQDTINLLPKNMRTVGGQIAQEMLSNPKTKESAQKFYDAVQRLSGGARVHLMRNAATVLKGGKPEKAQPQVQAEIDKFWKELGPEGQAYAKKLAERIQSALTEEKQTLSNDEKDSILEGARQELDKFDLSKASEIDKNILLGRLQMRGIDVSGGEEILKNPSKLKVFEGSPMERGFNQIMGLIGYLLMSIQKMKDSLKPGEKKGPDAPVGDKGKAGPEAQAMEKEGAKKKLLEEMKTKSKTGNQLKTEKEGRQATLKTEIPKREKEVTELTKQLEGVAEGDEKTRSQEHLKEMSDGLAKDKQESTQLAQDIVALQEMKTTTENLKSILSAGKDALFAYLDRGDVGRKVSGGRVLADNLQKISFVVNDRFELALANDRGAPIDPTVLKDVSGAITFKMRSGVDYLAVDDQGVLKQPENLQTLFNQLLDGFKAEVKAEETPVAHAPAPAGAPPAAGPAAPAR